MELISRYYYNNDFERRRLDSYYTLYDNPPVFENAFRKLIAGMDNDSVHKVTSIIERQKQIRGTKGEMLDIYTLQEQKQIDDMQRYMSSHTLKISESLWCYEHYFLPENCIEPSVFYYKHGIDELTNSGKIVGKDIVDVGGYIGDSVLILEQLSPKLIYTFEASSANFKRLEKTIKLNEISNCIAENMALGEEEGISFLNLNDGMSNLNTLTYTTKCEGKEEVRVQTLDKYAQKNNLDIGLIKVDIEGAEQMFLRGAKETICRQRPTLLLSIYHSADDFFGIKPMIESWDLGYKFKIHKPNDGSISREVLLICEID